ncbi:Chromo domain-containing protein 2 [Fusarium oxysporum f. sp. rapae]|uniref:Chromo domain-containing protein 2 n=1 Tax=Fusarium oxysporum f. sp. rapae TaxID=485398 RepID=A0A8J5TPA6_FUSOX|nr:Chromo domain-containing protein 2 [Fusarium oxysporum f. sp. rapae]
MPPGKILLQSPSSTSPNVSPPAKIESASRSRSKPNPTNATPAPAARRTRRELKRSDDKSSNQGKFTALAQGSRRSTSHSPLLVVNPDKVEAPKGVPTGESDEEDGELEDDLFIVEKIKNHAIDKNGNLVFQVKWKGFESKKDLTWEPEDNLKVSGDEILNEYFDAIGGRDKIVEESNKAANTKKRRLTTNDTSSTRPKRLKRNEAHVGDKTLPAALKKWSPPSGSWEDEIEKIDTCEEDDNEKLIVCLIWKNGQTTKHEAQTIYKKCPQKMLKFYEEHVKIVGKEKCHERRQKGLLGGVIP